MMTDQHTTRAAIVVASLTACLIIPTTVAVIVFNRKRRHPVVFKSRPLLCLLITILTCVGSLIVQPLWFLGRIGVLPAEFILVNASSAGFTWFVTFWAVAIYAWLLHYDVVWNFADTNRTWREKLNPDTSNDDWYIAHKQKFGTIQQVIRKTWIIPLCVAIETTVMNYLWYVEVIPFLVAAVNVGAIGLTYFLFVCVVWCRTPSFNDVFGRRKRFRWYVWIMMGNFVAWLCSLWLSTDHYVAWLFASLGFGVIAAGTTVYSFMISPLLTIRKYDSPEKILGRAALATGDIHADTKNSFTFAAVVQKLSSMEMYSAFMLHLSKELSVESMLFLTELTQFKEDLLRRIHLIDGGGLSVTLSTLRTPSIGAFVLELSPCTTRQSFSSDVDANILFSTTPTLTPGTDTESPASTSRRNPTTTRWMLKLPNGVPLSNIFADAADTPALCLAELLYKKYVSNHAELEINISSDARHSILSRLSSVRMHFTNDGTISRGILCDMLEMYDEAGREIFLLVQRSWILFSCSKAYKEVQEGSP